MPDFAMCADQGCDHRRRCRRYRAQPALVQSWFDPSPREPGWTQCEYLDVIRSADDRSLRTMTEIEGELVS